MHGHGVSQYVSGRVFNGQIVAYCSGGSTAYLEGVMECSRTHGSCNVLDSQLASINVCGHWRVQAAVPH
jgi:hypothetical protein